MVNENHDVIALQNEISVDANEWEENERDASYLYSGARLSLAEEQVTAHKITLSGLPKEFIDEGLKERKRKEILRRRMLIGLIVGLIVTVTLAAFSILQANLAQQQAKISRARELAVQSVTFHDSDLSRSLLLSIEAIRMANIPQTRSILLDNMQVNSAMNRVLRGHAGPVWSVAFSPNGKILASGGCGEIDDDFNCLKGEVLLWDFETGKQVGRPLIAPGEVFSVAFSPDRKTLASGDDEGSITFWNMMDPQSAVQSVKAHKGYVTSLAFSADGMVLASGSMDRTIILWDVVARQPFDQPLAGHGHPITTLVFSPDGKTLASGGTDRTIILWNTKTREPVGQPLTGHIASIYSLAFSPDGKMLASAGADRNIILWNVKTQKPIGQPLTGPTHWINSPAFSPDNSTLASGSSDNNVILWDIESRQQIGKPLSGHTDWVNSVAFSPNGEVLASGSCRALDAQYNCTEGEILIWNLNEQSWITNICQIAQRNFTFEEWTQFFPDEEYRKSCNQWPNHASYYQAVSKGILSDSEDRRRAQKALEEVNKLMQLDSAVESSNEEISQIVPEMIKTQISTEIRAGKLQQGLDLLEQARSLQLGVDDADLLNDICWDGSLQGYANQVMLYCDEAVTIGENDPAFRDSRGIARVMTGDYLGAIDDFQFFIDNTDLDESYIQQRQDWIADLHLGRNPFTPDVLDFLLDS